MYSNQPKNNVKIQALTFVPARPAVIIFDTGVYPLYFSGRSIEPIIISAMCQLVEDSMNVKCYVLTDSVVSASMSYLIIYPTASVSRLVS